MVGLVSIVVGYDCPMELHQLRYFVAVAERRHFTRAAAELHVAQPSVSKQIQKLEAELGTPLFHRQKGHPDLTPAGELLLPWARRVLADLDGARSEIQEMSALLRGRLSVGATPSLATALLPAPLALFHERYPGVELTLAEAGSRDLVDRLVGGELDVALVILPAPHAALVTTPLFREELVVAVARAHPLAKRRSLAVADLRGVPLVMFREGYDLRAATLAACEAAGFRPSFALEGGEMDGVLRIAAAGVGAAVVPSMVVEPDGPLVALRLVRPAVHRTIGLARRRDRHVSRAAQVFADGVRAFLREGRWPIGRPKGLVVL